MIFAGISLAGGGAITGTDILFHYSLKDIILYALKVLYFIAFTYLTGTTLGKESDESPGSFKKSGREADTVQCGVPRDGWKILM